MTTNPLPDLSKWHEVPADADIPKRVRFVYLDSEGGWTTGPNNGGRLAANKGSRGRYFTAEPIPAPRPTPPTEPGTVLVSWTVADVVPRTPDPLDENDHRDRVDVTNDLLVRRECGYWHWAWTGGGARCPLAAERHATGGTKYTLADWTGVAGPLRFADEVSA